MSGAAMADFSDLVKMLDRKLFESFADKLVRHHFFTQFCNEDDKCLLIETDMLERAEQELREHLTIFRSRHMWEAASDLVDTWIKVLIRRRIAEEVDMDVEERDFAQETLFERDFKSLISIRESGVSERPSQRIRQSDSSIPL